jgi:hypothetical protein
MAAIIMESVVEAQGDALQDPVDGYYDPLLKGDVRTPALLDGLGEVGLDPTKVAILRFVYRYAGSEFECFHQPTLAKQMALSLSTAQRAIECLLSAGLIDKRKAKRKPADRGYLCEYRICWKGVYELLHLPPQPDPRSSQSIPDLYANDAKKLPFKFFARAWWKDGRLVVETKDGTQYSLPGDDREVLRYVIGKHFGKPVPAASMDTYVHIAPVVTPRLLSLLTIALAVTKTVPRSPAYYTKVLQDKRIQAKLPPQSGSRKSAPIRMITIR